MFCPFRIELWIAHDKPILFLAIHFGEFRALVESLKVLKKVKISGRKMQIIVMMGS